MSIHYALSPEVDKTTYLGGVLAAGDTSIDVLKDLKAGGGVIEIADDDHVKAAVLDGYQPLQRVPEPEVPGEAAAPEPESIVATTGHPLRLTDERREELATRPIDATSESKTSGTTPSRSASRTDKKES